MPPPNAETRPLAGTGSTADAFDGTAILPTPTDTGVLCDAFVMVVSTPLGRHRRTVYLSLHAAEKALRRAWDAGKPASLTLCRLSPVEPQEVASWAA